MRPPLQFDEEFLYPRDRMLLDVQTRIDCCSVVSADPHFAIRLLYDDDGGGPIRLVDFGDNLQVLQTLKFSIDSIDAREGYWPRLEKLWLHTVA